MSFINKRILTSWKHNILNLAISSFAQLSLRTFVRPLPNCELYILKKKNNKRISMQLAQVVMEQGHRTANLGVQEAKG